MASAAPLEAMRIEIERIVQRNIKGLGYFASPAPVVGATPKDVLVSQGPWRLYHYHPRVDEVYRVPVLLVMATTNRGYVFDMIPGQSLVEFLLDRGYDVFMVDWEAPRPEDRHLTLANYVHDFVGGSVERVKQVTGEPDVSVLGDADHVRNIEVRGSHLGLTHNAQVLLTVAKVLAESND